MAVKKPAKKAAKAIKKPAKPVAKKPAAKPAAGKSSAKPVARKAATRKAVPKKAPAKKVVAKPAPAKRPVAKPAKKAAQVAPAKAIAKKATKPVAKTAAVAKKVAKPAAPAKAAAAKPAPEKKVSPVKASMARGGAKQPASEPARPTVTKSPFAPRPVGKVAVAIVAKPAAPAPKVKVKVVPYKVDETTGRPIIPNGYRPAADEEYMSPLQIEYFRQRLLGWRADLVEESKQTIENLKDEVRDVGDEAERATRETENSLELRTRDRYRKLIGKIDSTLKRVDSGEYGYSVDSGEEIGLERLEARLTAERTIDEQERWEHLQKQIGD